MQSEYGAMLKETTAAFFTHYLELFEQAIAMSDNLSHRIDALNYYRNLHPNGTPEAADVYRRYEVVKRINEATKHISEETKAPRQAPETNVATMRLVLAERSK